MSDVILDMSQMSEENQKVLHILIDHLVPSYEFLVGAELELNEYSTTDERLQDRSVQVKAVLKQIDDLINDLFDLIPGVPSREEAEAEAALQAVATEKGFVFGVPTPDKEVLN